MWCFPAHNRHGSVLFSAISVCDWAMDPERGELSRETHPEAHSCPLVVLWCWSGRGVRHLPDCGGAVRGDWVRVYKNVLFAGTARCHSAAPVWKRNKKKKGVINNLNVILQYVPHQQALLCLMTCTRAVFGPETSTAQVESPLLPHIFLHQTVEQKHKEPWDRRAETHTSVILSVEMFCFSFLSVLRVIS